jgi:hypothetical protein
MMTVLEPRKNAYLEASEKIKCSRLVARMLTNPLYE